MTKNKRNENVRASISKEIPRAEIQDSAVEFIRKWSSAPYGVLTGFRSNGRGKARTVTFDGAHSALADIEATARCFWALTGRPDISAISPAIANATI